MASSTVLITGASGKIGSALAARLAGRPNTNVVCISRKSMSDQSVMKQVIGNFADRADLDRAIASSPGHTIDTCVHLAAQLSGGNGTEGQLQTNVVDTFTLISHLADAGCRKFVLASSIAATGCLNDGFRPVELPMPDEHPCLDVGGYGSSKYLMEEMSRYASRQNTDLDIINLRIAGIVADDVVVEPYAPSKSQTPHIVSLGRMRMGDMLRCLELSIDRVHRPGSVQVINAVHPSTQLVPAEDCGPVEHSRGLKALLTDW
eukprot:COSAG05_NODE_1025_length_6123_cov_5.086985_2_plen_261_part_00